MKKRYWILFVLAAILVLGGLFLLLKKKPAPEPVMQTPDPVQTEAEPEPAKETKPPVQEKKKTPEPEEEKEPYVSPVDFAALQEKNPDIYAWLSIPGTEAEFPVLQRSDDTYYLTHDADGNYSLEGAIYSESAYNDKSFDEAITVLYGHRMKNGDMLGCLQPTYYDLEQLRTYQEMIIYLPEKELHYQIFAAVPYDCRHILYNYGNENPWKAQYFLKSLTDVKALDAVIDEEAMAGKEPLTVLSTCLYGDRNQRYLVVGKLTETIN